MKYFLKTKGEVYEVTKQRSKTVHVKQDGWTYVLITFKSAEAAHEYAKKNGFRENKIGRPLKFGEESIVVTVRIPLKVGKYYEKEFGKATLGVQAAVKQHTKGKV